MITLHKIQAQIIQFKHHVALKDVQNLEVSAGNISWHIAHSMLVVVKMISAMEKSDPATFRPSFSFLKFAMFTFKKIPRGKRKAPNTVQPPEQYAIEYLEDLFNKVNQKLLSLQSLPVNANVQHPALGLINKEEALKFLYVHNLHHLKIIDDIKKNK